ncbi:hypothetical protein M0657_009085 [Pyricularia oryzae]|uniref:Uncharacterized protein n=1 Tax=Pyricularia oryzae TaxID=318829 RepID=A0A4P7N5L6_PYROR|nr:hypothetical protein M9X92_010510 [Pyricularia oryzae]KAI7915371.1 hypothetical protein M0657_009085 [Pyricularia oryzae]QBZ56852.1 hypothetical protein PoMZ_01769 [Pyricularia oryzae]
MKTTTTFTALSVLAFMTTSTLASRCVIFKAKRGLNQTPEQVFMKAPSDSFCIDGVLCRSSDTCYITCDRVDHYYKIAGGLDPTRKSKPREEKQSC